MTAGGTIKKSILFTALTQLPSSLLGIISGIFITRLLGTSGRGLYAVFSADVALITLLVGFNLTLGISHYISSKRSNPENILAFACFSFLISSGLAITFLYILYNSGENFIFPRGYQSQFYFFYLVFSVVLNLLNSLISAVFQGFQKFKRINQVTLINGAINTVLFGVVFLIYDVGSESNIVMVLLITLIIVLINSIIWISFYIRDIRITPRFGHLRQVYKMMTGFLLIGYLANLLNFLNYRLDIWLVEYFTNFAELGLYSLAVNISQLLWLLTSSIVFVLQPHMANPDSKEKLKKFSIYSRLNFTLIAVLALLSVPVSFYLIPILYGQEFYPAVWPYLVLLPGIIFGSVTKIFAILSIVINKPKYNLVTTLVGLLFTVVLDLWLIPQWGILGASLATSISYFTMMLTLFYFVFGKLGYPVRNYFIIIASDISYLKNDAR